MAILKVHFPGFCAFVVLTQTLGDVVQSNLRDVLGVGVFSTDGTFPDTCTPLSQLILNR